GRQSSVQRSSRHWSQRPENSPESRHARGGKGTRDCRREGQPQKCSSERGRRQVTVVAEHGQSPSRQSNCIRGECLRDRYSVCSLSEDGRYQRGACSAQDEYSKAWSRYDASWSCLTRFHMDEGGGGHNCCSPDYKPGSPAQRIEI